MNEWKVTTAERGPKVTAVLKVTDAMELYVSDNGVQDGYHATLFLRTRIVGSTGLVPTVEAAKEAGIALVEEIRAEFAQAAQALEEMRQEAVA